MHLDEGKIKSGEWKHIANPLTTKAKFVASSISEQWEKSLIPHEDLTRKNSIKVEHLISKIRTFKRCSRLLAEPCTGDLFFKSFLRLPSSSVSRALYLCLQSLNIAHCNKRLRKGDVHEQFGKLFDIAKVLVLVPVRGGPNTSFTEAIPGGSARRNKNEMQEALSMWCQRKRGRR